MGTIVIDPRFHGPPNSGNGGYACGLAAGQVDEQVQVALRCPPPLGSPMSVVASGDEDTFEVRAGNRLVATMTPCDPIRLAPPAAVSVDEAVAAAHRYAYHDDHPFPTCWVCGPDRAPDDGLRIFPGALEGATANQVAAPWTPREELGDGAGVAVEHVWAALDCPSYMGLGVDQPAVLGGLTVTQHGSVRVGEPHVVHGWTREPRAGRLLHGASAITTVDGELVASAAATWVAISEAQLAAFAGWT